MSNIPSQNQIIIGVKNVPEIWYIDENNIEHRYYVDIFIPSQNKCIEVKSLYTYNKNKKINILKSEATKKLGFIYEFWIYDNKGNKLNYGLHKQVYNNKKEKINCYE